jgi:hypothetical protein
LALCSSGLKVICFIFLKRSLFVFLVKVKTKTLEKTNEEFLESRIIISKIREIVVVLPVPGEAIANNLFASLTSFYRSSVKI